MRLSGSCSLISPRAMKSIEFYKTPQGEVMCKPVGGSTREITEQDREFVQDMLDLIRTRYPKAFEALSEMYSKSELNRAHFEFQIVSRFIRCNFGEYDANTTDIDADGFFRFEEVGCPMRGECLFEGVICKPELDTGLSRREREVLELICAGCQTQEIAERLIISPLTVNRHRENIKAKTGMRTLAQLTSWFQSIKNQ